MQTSKPIKIGLAPRLAAFYALLNWKNKLGFVQNNLRQTCETLPPNDRALAYEIALGTCRTLKKLDEKLSSIMRKLPEEPCRTILEMSLYQLLCTRVPSYAVVNSAANLARQITLDEQKVKFVNAVLRNALRRNFEKIEKIVTEAPLQWIRVNSQKTTLEKLAAELGLETAKTFFNKFILISNTSDILKNPLFQQGFYSFQNPASFFVAKMCEIKANHKILDACSAPGGKTAMLAEDNPDAFFIATDCSEKRAKKILDLQNRIGLKNVHIAIANAENLPFSQEFDCAIVDAPCSNMGVVARRPEVAQRISKEKIEELAKRQLAILQGVSAYVKNCGILIYSVCSQEKKETIEVIENFLAANSNFIIEEFLFTDVPELDSFFIAKIKKNVN